MNKDKQTMNGPISLEKITLVDAYQIGDRWYQRTRNLLAFGMNPMNNPLKRRKAMRLFMIMKSRVAALMFIVLDARNKITEPITATFEPDGIVIRSERGIFPPENSGDWIRQIRTGNGVVETVDRHGVNGFEKLH